MKVLGNIHSCDDKSHSYCCMQQPNQDDVEIEFLDEYQMPSHTMEVATAPEICFRVDYAHLSPPVAPPLNGRALEYSFILLYTEAMCVKQVVKCG